MLQCFGDTENGVFYKNRLKCQAGHVRMDYSEQRCFLELRRERFHVANELFCNIQYLIC